MLTDGNYGYRRNFRGKKVGAKKKQTVTKLRLHDLIIDGYMMQSKYDEDYFVSIAQFLMQQGYPKPLYLNFKSEEQLQKFFMEALFSINPFHFENLWINYNKFNVLSFRKQFDLFSEAQIKGLSFYGSRAAMPIPNFTAFEDIKAVLFLNNKIIKDGSTKQNTLNFSPNSHWKDAIWILKKAMEIKKDYFIYYLTYGLKADFEGKGGSSWAIKIVSEKGENYVDFCMKIYNNYEKILNGDSSIFQNNIPTWKHSWNDYMKFTPSV